MTVVDASGVVACVGEPLVCFASPPGESLLDSGLAQVSEGGAELNVAIHLARLGVAVRFVGAVGDDVLGRRLVRRLRRENVDVSGLRLEAGERTGAYVKEWSLSRDVVYLRAGTAASCLAEVPAAALRGVSHVHVTGITASLSAACGQLLDALVAPGRSYTVSFDVNFRDRLWPAEEAGPRLADLARGSDLVFVGQDEAEHLWGATDPGSVRRLLPDVAELVVKDDARPASVWSGGVLVRLAPEPVTVVEPVGAGDAFAAGYVYGRSLGYEPRAALAAAHRLARGALEAPDDLGAPVPPEEIQRLLKGTV